MASKSDRIRLQFNRSAAGSYDKHAHVQHIMAEWLIGSVIKQKQESLPDGIDILEIGCGTGFLTELAVRHYFCSSILALDIAPAMLDAAEQRIGSITDSTGSRSRVRFLQADVEIWAAAAPSASFDLIVSSACFQWLNHPGETLIHLRRLLRPGGLLMFTTFGQDTFCELHEAFDEVYQAEGLEPRRHGLPLLSKEDWQALLLKGGFASVRVEQSVKLQIYSSVSDFLHSVKGVGASTSEADTARGLSRRLITAMFKTYQEKFSVPGGIVATYDLLLLEAVAPC
ncbi:malonyl-CoA O-methyltransferase [Paenibacillus darwinianus]|uniref:Malonyl-[acyl-carrier protein] O-methyltransferase n=1 Tax=Paenibacillus darwinianus TaxID=1380763 RepID=A0A9W5S257_9BACL|nr:malonyl-ACP O-methyltransferase BioC [Paenibacillus darwinianus]EXX89503.1 malonyl-CoA O-methyltransferase [Paenibacillus darwinianus]EXX90716.1 malonyl-CoA O-methyltransferase [Paenibacillus darwinianus]EXX90924.1 malonyl-CoA O-methyltransferase [Paenibacillus darwinianus]